MRFSPSTLKEMSCGNHLQAAETPEMQQASAGDPFRRRIQVLFRATAAHALCRIALVYGLPVPFPRLPIPSPRLRY